MLQELVLSSPDVRLEDFPCICYDYAAMLYNGIQEPTSLRA